MRIFTIIIPCIASIAVACNQNSSSSTADTPKAVRDLRAENLKGEIKKVETETYFIDSTTGGMGELESRSTEVYDDSGFTVSYSNYVVKDSSTTASDYGHDDNGFTTTITTKKK